MDAAPGRLAVASGEQTSDHGEARPRGNEPAMKDNDLRRHVAAELSWDPQVGSEAIEVSAASGVVTLRGTVTSLRLKRAGGRAAARVRGVTWVANELRVQIPDKDRRDDEDLRGDVLETLMLDVSVPTTVDAQARDGFVTLTQTPDAQEARDAISAAFRRDAVLAADGLLVETSADGLVILSGMVSSWAAHDRAVAAAWSAPGVTQVDDRIHVESGP